MRSDFSLKYYWTKLYPICPTFLRSYISGFSLGGFYIRLELLCVCVLSSHSFWISSSLDVPAGVKQEEGHTGFNPICRTFLRSYISGFSLGGFYIRLELLCVVCVLSSLSFWTSSSLDVPAGVTQEEGHTGFFIHLPSAVRALILLSFSGKS